MDEHGAMFQENFTYKICNGSDLTHGPWLANTCSRSSTTKLQLIDSVYRVLPFNEYLVPLLLRQTRKTDIGKWILKRWGLFCCIKIASSFSQVIFFLSKPMGQFSSDYTEFPPFAFLCNNSLCNLGIKGTLLLDVNCVLVS